MRWLFVLVAMATSSAAADPMPPEEHAGSAAGSASTKPPELTTLTDDPIVGKSPRVNGDEQKGIVAFTFDDGPNPKTTPFVLDALKAHHIHAVFFMIGDMAKTKEAPELIARILREGHIIGNHSFSHYFWFDLFSSAKMLDDMLQTNQSVRQTINLSPLLFRPPYGVINPNLKTAILKSRMVPIGWSVRSMDTVINDPEKLLNKITRRLNPGAIFLFHDTGAATISVLPLFIEQAKAQGYEIVRLDKILNLQAYA